MVVYGYVAKSRPGPKDGERVSEFRVLEVLKSDPAWRGGKIFSFPRYVPVKDANRPPHFVIYVDLDKNGAADPWRGDESPSLAYVQYVRQAIAQDERDRAKLLVHYALFLDHEDADVRIDAHREFVKARFKDVRAAAGALAPERILRWMQQPELAYQCGLHALLLGARGDERHALFLRERLADSANRECLNELLAGYALLKPAAGLSCIRGILHDPHHDFVGRFRAFQATRFLVENCSDRFSKADGLALVLPTLAHDDFADLTVNALRDWEQWQVTDMVLALDQDPLTPPNTALRTAVLRFALQSPDPRATTFVQRRRRLEPERVRDVEQQMGIGESKVNGK